MPTVLKSGPSHYGRGEILRSIEADPFLGFPQAVPHLCSERDDRGDSEQLRDSAWRHHRLSKFQSPFNACRSATKNCFGIFNRDYWFAINLVESGWFGGSNFEAMRSPFSGVNIGQANREVVSPSKAFESSGSPRSPTHPFRPNFPSPYRK